MWEVMNTMTTREAFETEAKKHGFILDRLDKSGEYVQLITEQAWNIWQAATNAALERAAKACQNVARKQGTIARQLAAMECGEVVRALKDETE